MIPKIIDFPVSQNAQMLKACVNPAGCPSRVSKIQMMDGNAYELCFCPMWGVSKGGTKIMYPCGFEMKIPKPGEEPARDVKVPHG